MKIKEISEKKVWEEFICQYSPASIFQSWTWGEIIKKKIENRKNKILLRLGIFDNSNFVGIAQVEKVDAKRGVFFHIRHGPIFSIWKSDYTNFLINYLKNLDRQVSFIRISPLLAASSEHIKFFKNLGFLTAPIPRLDGEICWVLDISDEENLLLSRMR